MLALLAIIVERHKHRAAICRWPLKKQFPRSTRMPGRWAQISGMRTAADLAYLGTVQMTKPFRDVPELALRNKRIPLRLRRMVPPGVLDRVRMPYPSRLVSFAGGELPC